MKIAALSIAFVFYTLGAMAPATAGLRPTLQAMAGPVERVQYYKPCPYGYHREQPFYRCVPDRFISSSRFCRHSWPGGPPRCRRF